MIKSIRLALCLSSTIVLTTRANPAEMTAMGAPFGDAVAVWHLADAKNAAGKDGTLAIEGRVRLGVDLSGAEREASLRRGGDGRVAEFDGGYLKACLPGDPPLNLLGQEMTLYVRLQDSSGHWMAALFSRDDKEDKYGNILFGADGCLHYVWRTEPVELRTLDSRAPRPLYGFNGEGNDQHHLSAYQPGEFAVSALTLDSRGTVTLLHNGHKSGGQIDIDKQDIGNALFRVGAKHDGSELLEGDIAEILVYNRVISETHLAEIERSLRAKWNLGSAGAPTDRPFPSGGLALHLDANDVSSGGGILWKPGPLAAWKDTSGAGRLVTQTDPSRQPELVAAALAGKPVVRFRGRQYLDGGAVLPPGCKELSFIAVWRRDHASGSEVIFEQSSPGIGKRACLLTTGEGARQGRDFADGILRLRVPVAVIEPTRWHDVLVRFRGANLELFVDGVLVDEEWPHGGLYRFSSPFLIGAGYEEGRLKAGFRGKIDHVALWNRALKDAEITALAGGSQEVTRRDREMLGAEQSSMQYWKPRGFNAWAGDCMPFYHDGTFHLFYLFDRRHHGSKWGQGAHQYAHASTTDLIHWQHHPLALPILEQWECSMGTCDCFFHNGVYHMFYTDCGDRCEYLDKPQRGSWIFAATSTDGVHFQKDFKPLVPGGDCTVFRDPATGLFQLIRGGGNRWVSKDLRHWEETPGDFVRRKPGTSGECPHLFEWNGWFYFILGTDAVWKSRSALGPWEEMKPDIYDGLFVPKVAEFTGNRRLLAGFLFERGWAGNLALREVVQFPDGSLGAKFPPELAPASGQPQELPFQPIHPEAKGDHSRVWIQAPGRFAAGMLTGVPRNCRLTLQVVPQPGVKAFGVCLRGSGDYENGCELRFEPSRRRAQYGVPHEHGLAVDSTGRIALGRDFAIQDVERLDRPFTLEVIVKDDIVDTCIDQRRTMISRRDPQPLGNRMFFFAQDGAVDFKSVEVRSLQ